jgi:hypothetical protein
MGQMGNDVDVGRSVIKTFLSAVAPMIKVPFELAMNRSLFTDRVIKSTETEVGQERIRLGQTVQKPFEIFAEIVPEDIQKAIGFEVATDPRDGLRKAYVNPYLMYTMKSMVPALNDVVRTLDDRLTPTETAVSILAGVSQYKLDLKQQAEYRRVALKKIIDEKKKEIQNARKQGRFMSEEALWNELRDITRTAMVEWQNLDLDRIRGTDLDPATGGDSAARGLRFPTQTLKKWNW